MPFKEEDINSEPNIKIYHDVLFDGEILKLKKVALKGVSVMIDKVLLLIRNIIDVLRINV